jgi:predicted aspartyl protease
MAQPERQRDLDLMVDTGSLFTRVEASILHEVGIAPAETRQFRTITGSLIERKLGYALISWDGPTGSINVVFGEPGDMAILGVTALESLTVTADPIQQTLVPTVALAV